MIPAMRFFTLALRFEVDGSPALSLTGIRSKMRIERRAVGAIVVVPVGLAFVAITIVVVVIAVMIAIMLNCKLALLRSKCAQCHIQYIPRNALLSSDALTTALPFGE